MTSKPKFSSFLRHTLRALLNRNYRLFFAGQIVSLTGTWITNIATSWLVFRLTGSTLALGVVSFATQFPAFLAAPFMGLLVDRYDRRRLLLLTQTLSMLQSFTLAALTFTDRISVPWLVALCVFQGIVNALDMPCRQAFVLDIVEKRENLGNAIALNSSIFNAARLVGPAIGGVLIAAVGEAWCFFIDGVSYLAVIVSLANIVLTVRRTVEAPAGGPMRQFMEGLRYAAGFRPIRTLILLVALVNLLGVPYLVLMPAFAASVLKGGPHVLGFLMSAAGGGALAGALWLAARKSVLGLGRVIPLATLCFGLGLIGFSFARHLAPAVVCLFLAGWGFMVQIAASNTILQTIVQDDKRGRVMSLFIMAFMGTAPFGSLIAGAVSDRIGAPHTLLGCGLCCLAVGLWFRRELAHIREAIHPIYQTLGILPQVAKGIQTATRLTQPPEE